jgi:hypothetical protein
MSIRMHWLTPLLLSACVVRPNPGKPAEPEKAAVPTPTVADPLNGLPAISGDGQLLALPTFTTGEQGQERSIAFIALGDTEGPGTSLDVPATPPAELINQLSARFRATKFTSLPWTLTPDDPPMPMTITIKGTELYFAGDPKAKLAVAVAADGHPVGQDVYQLEGESETSPERVVAVGATVLWQQDRGFAYVRYDVNDGVGRDSDWRVVVLEMAKAEPKPEAKP